MTKSIVRILLIFVAALALAGCEIRSNEIMETTDAASTGTHAAASTAARAAKTPGQ